MGRLGGFRRLTIVARNPPEDFAEDLPLGGVADVDGREFIVGGDKKVGAAEALETGYLEAEVAMGHYGDALVEAVAVFDGGIDKEDGTGADGGNHGFPVEVHADHVFRMRAPIERRQQHVFDLDLGKADVFAGRDAVAVGGDVEQRDGDGVSLLAKMFGEFARGDETEVLEAHAKRRKRLKKAGVEQAGGVHAGALPEVDSVGGTGEVAQGDVALCCGLVAALKPARDRRRGDAETLGKTGLAEFQIDEEPAYAISPLARRFFVSNHPGIPGPYGFLISLAQLRQ